MKSSRYFLNLLLLFFTTFIMLSESIAQTGTIIINKVTHPHSSGLDFNFSTSPGLTINSPITYNITAAGAVFGPQLNQTGITGNLHFLYNEGCDPTDYAGFAPGSIAVIDRGICTFVLKALNAQNAGAIGVIIINNIAGGGAIGLGGSDPNVTIPSICISYEDGLLIKSLPALNATMNKELEDFSLQDGATKTFTNVPAGTFVITEGLSLFEGAVLSDIIITDPSGGSIKEVDWRRVSVNLSPGETVECTFITDIRVVEDLLTDIEDLLNTGVLNSGQANALAVKLNNAKIKLNEGKFTSAINLLNAFINQVTDLINNGILSVSQGEPLIDEANAFIDLIRSNLPKSFSEGETTDEVPSDYRLLQNFPNPFNPNTSISYQLPADGYVTLKVYDLLGKEIATLVDGHNDAGYYRINFDASSLSSGFYFYRLSTENYVSTMKMLLIK